MFSSASANLYLAGGKVAPAFKPVGASAIGTKLQARKKRILDALKGDDKNRQSIIEGGADAARKAATTFSSTMFSLDIGAEEKLLPNEVRILFCLYIR